MESTAHTKTGGFPIGVRRGWGAWQRDLDGWLAWVKENRFAFVDLGNDGDRLLPAVQSAGVAVGSVDLPCWRELLSADAGRRNAAVFEATACVQQCAAAGVRRFLTIMRPEEPERPREENFDHMIESYAQLAPVLEVAEAAVVIEGWPGPGVLCCTPETLRALFAELPSRALAINHDPSHLIRMGIDPLHFVDEFSDRILHMHAKDTELLAEGLYEFGHEQPATFAARRDFGGWSWRYTIPGRGAMRWTEALTRLAAAGYRGGVSIELEDAEFCGADASEQRGLLLARDFLASC
jgi:sugar phosphate isomerase/epimerase